MAVSTFVNTEQNKDGLATYDIHVLFPCSNFFFYKKNMFLLNAFKVHSHFVKSRKEKGTLYIKTV